MIKYKGYFIFNLLLILVCISLYSCNNMGPECASLTNVEIHYKNYFNIYLGDHPFLSGIDERGVFVKMIRQATALCCSTATVTFHPISKLLANKEIEELVLESVVANRNPNVLRFFSPEFAYKKLLSVYDSQTPFIPLSRSPGPAVIMHTKPPKDPVFVGEIFFKSWNIIVFLMSFAWIIGILVWLCVS